MPEKMIRHCGNGWAYCDGNCKKCDEGNFYIYHGTDTGMEEYVDWALGVWSKCTSQSGTTSSNI